MHALVKDKDNGIFDSRDFYEGPMDNTAAENKWPRNLKANVWLDVGAYINAITQTAVAALKEKPQVEEMKNFPYTQN